MTSPRYSVHSLGREIIFDWHEAPIASLVHGGGPLWFYRWLVAWEPGRPRRTYAFRAVTAEWRKRQMRVLGEPPATVAWVVGPQAPEAKQQCDALRDELFSDTVGEVLIAEPDRSGHRACFWRVDATTLGAFARPRQVEEIVAADERERQRLWDLTAVVRPEAAREIATSVIEVLGADIPGGLTILDERTLEKPYGWVFFYNSTAYLKTGSIEDALAGNGPFAVLRNGAIHSFGTSGSFATQLPTYEARESALLGELALLR